MARQFTTVDSPVVMKFDLPATLLVDGLALSGKHVVAHNLDVPGTVAQQLVQQGLNDRPHAAAQYDYGDVVITCPGVELLETRVQLDVCGQDVDAIVVWSRDTVHHLLEGVSEMHTPVQNILVPLDALLYAISQIVGHKVVGVARGDGTVKVGEEDELGIRSERRGSRVDGAHDAGRQGDNCLSRQDLVYYARCLGNGGGRDFYRFDTANCKSCLAVARLKRRN